jgi:hypothetical protein
MNKILQQGLPVPDSEEPLMERERNKTKALSKQVVASRRKVKELEKESLKWKAMFERELVGRSLQQ